MLLSDASTTWLEIPSTVQTDCWQQVQKIALAGDRWLAYLNLLSLQTVLPWVQEEAHTSPTLASAAHPAAGAVVNGFAISVNAKRLIFVPQEDCDRAEFRVPQEWIDQPDWSGDYYLAMEVEPDEGWVQVWGYTTHAQLKATGHYDAFDRTYTLESAALLGELSALWLMLARGHESTRAAVTPLTPLSSQHRAALRQTLETAISPRLVLPFAEWGALLADAHFFQHLCEQRQPGSPPVPATSAANVSAVQLSQWFQTAIATGWQTLEAWFPANPELALGFRQGAASAETERRYAKRISLGADLPEVLLALRLEIEPDQRRNIQVQVIHAPEERYLPPTLQVTLLSPGGERLQSAQASEESLYIQLRPFKCPRDRRFQIEIAIADQIIQEEFIA